MSTCANAQPPARNQTLLVLLEALFALRSTAALSASFTAEEVWDAATSAGQTLTLEQVQQGLSAGARRGLWRTACRTIQDPAPTGPFRETTYAFDRNAIARNRRNAAYAYGPLIAAPGNSSYPTSAGPMSVSCSGAKGSAVGAGHACCDEPAFPI